MAQTTSLTSPHLKKASSGESHQDISLKAAARFVLFAALITSIAVYTVWVKFQIDCKFLMADDIKKQNQRLDIRIKNLEAEIEELKSFDRIQRELSKAGMSVETPKRAFYINLTSSEIPVARLSGSAPPAD